MVNTITPEEGVLLKIESQAIRRKKDHGMPPGWRKEGNTYINEDNSRSEEYLYKLYPDLKQRYSEMMKQLKEDQRPDEVGEKLVFDTITEIGRRAPFVRSYQDKAVNAAWENFMKENNLIHSQPGDKINNKVRKQGATSLELKELQEDWDNLKTKVLATSGEEAVREWNMNNTNTGNEEGKVTGGRRSRRRHKPKTQRRKTKQQKRRSRHRSRRRRRPRLARSKRTTRNRRRRTRRKR